jgi:hypothetical protein
MAKKGTANFGGKKAPPFGKGGKKPPTKGATAKAPKGK